MIVSLSEIYKRCLNAKYTHTKEDGDYCLQSEGDTLYILFQWSNGRVDWANNFSFPAKPYKEMGVTWYAHRGFLRVWKQIKPFLEEEIKNPKYKKIVVVGYSHGAAIATFCHEWVWFNRPDLREHGLEGFGFGCPRVYWGKMKKEMKDRWKHFHPIRDMNDIVTHVPPRIFGFRHVNKLIKFPKSNKTQKCHWFGPVNAHYPENYMAGAEEWDKNPKEI